MTNAQSPTIGNFIFNNSQNGNTLLWRNALIMLVLCGVCVILQNVDDRLLHGANVWMKPSKFYFSIAVHMMTLSWAIMLLPDVQRRSKSVEVAAGLFIAASWFEMAYMTYRAALGEASHFNVASPFAAAMYNAMAAAATLMTGITAYLGIKIWRSAPRRILGEATGIGLILSAVLTTIVGFYLGGQGGHWIGGDMTDATGTGFFGWSTTGGDLRVSHFIAFHAAQILPLAGFSNKREVVYFAAVAIVVLTVLTFIQAISGVPLFRG
jgi:low affinity Fe/Cu permease